MCAEQSEPCVPDSGDIANLQPIFAEQDDGRIDEMPARASEVESAPDPDNANQQGQNVFGNQQNINGSVKGHAIGGDVGQIGNRYYFNRPDRQEELIQTVTEFEIRNYDIGHDLDGLELFIHAIQQLQPDSEWDRTRHLKLKMACRDMYERAKGWCSLLRELGQKALKSSLEKDLTKDETAVRILNSLEQAQRSSDSADGFSLEFHQEVVSLCREFTDTSFEEISPQLLRLYDQYSADILDLVVSLIRRLCYDGQAIRTDACNLLNSLLCQNEVHSTERRILLRHIALRPVLEQHASLDSLSTEVYRYWGVNRKTNRPLSASDALHKWLTLAELKFNPFNTPADFASDSLFYDTWNPPKHQVDIESDKDLLSTATLVADSYACALWLRHSLSSLERPSAFPIWHIFGTRRHTTETAITLAHSCAATWISFLAANPAAIHELSDNRRQLLAKLLSWATGMSSGSLKEVLRNQYERFENTEEVVNTSHFDWLVWFLSSVAEQMDNDVQPTTQEILAWLNLRPPAYTGTWLIIATQPNSLDVGDEINGILRLRPLLQEYDGLSLKLFVGDAPNPLPIGAIAQRPVTWTGQSLEKVLDDRIGEATGNKMSFGGLFCDNDGLPVPPGRQLELRRRMAETAQGSLSRLLIRGNRLVEQHIEKAPEDKYISEETLQAVLNEPIP